MSFTISTLLTVLLALSACAEESSQNVDHIEQYALEDLLAPRDDRPVSLSAPADHQALLTIWSRAEDSLDLSDLLQYAYALLRSLFAPEF